jgi:hypothetical protein
LFGSGKGISRREEKPGARKGGENGVWASSRPLNFSRRVYQKVITGDSFDSMLSRYPIDFFVSFAGIRLYVLVIEYFFCPDFFG